MTSRDGTDVHSIGVGEPSRYRYARCGLAGQMELGVRFQKCSVSAYLEGMTWGESPVVRDTLQPESRMLTVGGKLSYTF